MVVLVQVSHICVIVMMINISSCYLTTEPFSSFRRQDTIDDQESFSGRAFKEDSNCIKTLSFGECDQGMA